MRRVVAGVVLVLVVVLVACAPASGDPRPGASSPSDGAPPGALQQVQVLQLNLCSSGIAGCFTGRATDEAAEIVRTERPDLITLNESCRDDVEALERAIGEDAPPGTVTSAFRAARDDATGEAYRCVNGSEYGNGVVSRWPAVPGSLASGIFPDQDPADPEQRAWLCLDVDAGPALAVCTTHLAYTVRDVTAAQCRHLFGVVVADRRAGDGAVPLVVGADLNLGADSAELLDCFPPGSVLVDDGGPQHVAATPEFTVTDRRLIDLRGATDHPGLLVTFDVARS